MVLALLILILAVLLFGAGVVRGFLANAFGVIAALVVILLAVGYVKSSSDRRQADAERRAMIPEARTMALQAVAEAARRPAGDLMDVTTTVTEGAFCVSGTVKGTTGYTGSGGRQRFYSNGGGLTELEPQTSKADFELRKLYCIAGSSAG